MKLLVTRLSICLRLPLPVAASAGRAIHFPSRMIPNRAQYRRHFCRFILPLFMLVPSVLLLGADDPKPTLTLAEAKRLAFEHNWDLLAARSDVDAATAQKIIAKVFPNPTLSLSTQKINADNHPNSTTAGNGLWNRSYDTITAVNQLFEIGGKRARRQESAVAGFAAAESRLRDARRLLDAAVSRAYFAAILAGENVKILTQSAASLRREAQIAEIRLRAGDISKADKMQIEIAAARLELDAQTAESNAVSARIAMEVLVGATNPAGAWAPGDTLEQLAGLPFFASPVTPGASRPDVQAAEAAYRKASADLRLQRAMRVPDPTFLLQYEHQPPDQPNTLGFGVSFPLPLWNRNKGAIKAAEAAQTQAALQVEKVKAQAAAEIATAESAYTEAFARWRKYREQIRPQSGQIRETVSFAYEKGGASLLDLLSAERNDNDIRLATAQAMADSASAAASLATARAVSVPNSR